MPERRVVASWISWGAALTALLLAVLLLLRHEALAGPFAGRNEEAGGGLVFAAFVLLVSGLAFRTPLVGNRRWRAGPDALAALVLALLLVVLVALWLLAEVAAADR